MHSARSRSTHLRTGLTGISACCGQDTYLITCISLAYLYKDKGQELVKFSVFILHC